MVTKEELLKNLADTCHETEQLILFEVSRLSSWDKSCECEKPVTFSVIDDYEIKHYCLHCGGKIYIRNYGDAKYDE